MMLLYVFYYCMSQYVTERESSAAIYNISRTLRGKVLVLPILSYVSIAMYTVSPDLIAEHYYSTNLYILNSETQMYNRVSWMKGRGLCGAVVLFNDYTRDVTRRPSQMCWRS